MTMGVWILLTVVFFFIGITIEITAKKLSNKDPQFLPSPFGY